MGIPNTPICTYCGRPRQFHHECDIRRVKSRFDDLWDMLTADRGVSPEVLLKRWGDRCEHVWELRKSAEYSYAHGMEFQFVEHCIKCKRTRTDEP